MRRQTLLYILKINASVLFAIIPSVSGIVVFRTQRKLRKSGGKLHCLSVFLYAVFIVLPIVQLIKIDFPRNKAQRLDVLFHFFCRGISGSNPQTESKFMFIGQVL